MFGTNKKCTVTKSFEFDYGHRVYTQNVNQDLSGSNENSCRRLHGHRGKYLITFEGNVNEQGLVIDFKNLQFIKRFIDTFFDHKFIISKDDPLIANKLISPEKISKYAQHFEIITSDMMLNIATKEKIKLSPSIIKSNKLNSFDRLYSYIYSIYKVGRDYFLINIVSSCEDECINEWNSSFTISNFIPTAENFSRAMYYWMQKSLEMYLSNKINTKDLRVKKVEFFETPTSSSVFEG